MNSGRFICSIEFNLNTPEDREKVRGILEVFEDKQDSPFIKAPVNVDEAEQKALIEAYGQRGTPATLMNTSVSEQQLDPKNTQSFNAEGDTRSILSCAGDYPLVDMIPKDILNFDPEKHTLDISKLTARVFLADLSNRKRKSAIIKSRIEYLENYLAQSEGEGAGAPVFDTTPKVPLAQPMQQPVNTQPVQLNNFAPGSGAPIEVATAPPVPEFDARNLSQTPTFTGQPGTPINAENQNALQPGAGNINRSAVYELFARAFSTLPTQEDKKVIKDLIPKYCPDAQQTGLNFIPDHSIRAFYEELQYTFNSLCQQRGIPS